MKIKRLSHINDPGEKHVDMQVSRFIAYGQVIKNAWIKLWS